MRDVGARFREYAQLERKRAGGGLTSEELERWTLLKRALNRNFSPELSDGRADQRTSVRVPSRLKVSFGSHAKLRDSRMTNISRGGLFIATKDPFEIGTRFELQIHVEESGSVLEVPVQVVCQNVGPDFQADSGMGVRFLDLDPEQEKRLLDLYEKSLNEHAEAAAQPS